MEPRLTTTPLRFIRGVYTLLYYSPFIPSLCLVYSARLYLVILYPFYTVVICLVYGAPFIPCYIITLLYRRYALFIEPRLYLVITTTFLYPGRIESPIIFSFYNLVNPATSLVISVTFEWPDRGRNNRVPLYVYLFRLPSHYPEQDHTQNLSPRYVEWLQPGRGKLEGLYKLYCHI